MGLVDAVVGVLLLAVVALCVGTGFATLASAHSRDAQRIDKLTKEADALPRAPWL